MFLKEKMTNRKVQDFHGFNQHQSYLRVCKPKTKLIYTPFLDKTRSDPLIMMTVMIKAEIPTNKAGQAYTVFTADKQLHRVVLNII